MFTLILITWKKGEKNSKIILLTSTKFRTQYYSYDVRDLIGAVGGYFGLFLGWSFLSIFAWCIETIPNMKNNLKTVKNSLSII